MISELKGARLLRGYRGAPPADEAALRDVLLRISALVEAAPDIQELDLNPVIVLPSGACVADVRMRVEPTNRPATRAARRLLTRHVLTCSAHRRVTRPLVRGLCAPSGRACDVPVRSMTLRKLIAGARLALCGRHPL